jgi:hypothetical protein
MAVQSNTLMRGFEQGADGVDPWNQFTPDDVRGPLALDPQGVALARQFEAVKASLAAEQAPIWNPNNPVGTETTLPQQQMSMPDPSFRPGVFVGGGTVPMSREQLEGMRQGQQEFYDQASLLAGVGPAAAEGRAVTLASRRPLANPPPSRAPEPVVEQPSFTIYHGSPHLFAPTERNPLGEFDPTKIGTGEGAQAYGVGAGYGAENEGVARGYKMAGQPSYLNPTVAKIAQDAHGEAVQRGVDDPIAAARNSLWEQRQATTDPILKRQIDDAYNNIEQLTKPGGVGHMYEVKVAADPERFLHWDKPLSEQHQDVIKALNNTPYPPHDMRMTGKEYLTALETNREMASKQGDPAALASRALQEAGIPGIKYLDQGSRGAGAGSHNYVVFSPEIMNIIRRYGLAGLMGGAGAAALGGTQQESQ